MSLTYSTARAELSIDLNPSMKRKIKDRKMIDHEFPSSHGRKENPLTSGEKEMQMNNDYGFAPDCVAASREFIRSVGNGCMSDKE